MNHPLIKTLTEHGLSCSCKEIDMKKTLVITIALLLTSTYLLASPVFTSEEMELLKSTRYSGPTDDNQRDMRDSTLGVLARNSSVIGVGRLVGMGDGHFTITVDHALVGCTNGASLVIYRQTYDYSKALPEFIHDNYPPANQTQIVFAAYTNLYFYKDGEIVWSPKKWEPEQKKHLALRSLNRSWWPLERDNGMLFTQFTNVIQAVRIEPNWTNYFHLVRDGANSISNRVQEDSFYDLRSLFTHSTDEQIQIILDDPLVDPKHKSFHQILTDLKQKYQPD